MCSSLRRLSAPCSKGALCCSLQAHSALHLAQRIERSMKGALLAALLAAALVEHAAAAAAPAVDGLCEGSGWEALDPEVRVDKQHNF